MIKKLQQLKTTLIILLIIELLIGIIFNAFQNNILSLTLVIYLFIKNTISILIVLYTSSVISKNNLSVSDALNDDSKNALIYGGIGLVKYDENRNIVWVSDLLKEIGVSIIGHKVLEWQPLLAPLFEEEDVRIIDINSRKYEAYNSKDSRLIFLKDVDDYKTIEKEYEDQHMCFAYVSIDNYDDSIEYADEEKASTIATLARQTIYNYAKANGLILKQYKDDGYIIIFNERIYSKQAEEKFKILDDFREKMGQLNEVMSLSIGIGRGTTVIRELDELAFNALSMAYSRGGDQVVVKSNDEPVRFFGGNSESSEKANRVRARVIAQTLSGLIKQADNVIIMGHKQSDLDSLGGSIAMAAIAKALQKPAYIVLDFDSIEDKTRNVAEDLRDNNRYYDAFVSPNNVGEVATRNSLLICVDNHKPSLALSENVLNMISNKVVIDHHRRGEEFIELPILTYLEPAASSTVELVVELFDYLKVEVAVTQREATIMYAGMLIDTNYLKTRVGARTFLAAAKLRDMQADVNQAYEYLKDDFNTTLSKYGIMDSTYQFGDNILIAFGKESEVYTRSLLAKASNELMNISGIQAVFTVGNIGKGLIAISARSTKDINVQLIMEKLGGGGHFSMAACQLKETVIKNVTNKLEEAINEYLDERM